jgi:hypothetical protein
LPVGQFFEEAIADRGELKKLEQAWTKAVLLHITLWSRAYVQTSLW